METPILTNGQFAVGKAEFTTGIVLNNDGKYYTSGNDLNTMYEIFDSYIEAEKFVLGKIKNNANVECWIVDSNGNHVITYDKNGERK